MTAVAVLALVVVAAVALRGRSQTGAAQTVPSASRTAAASGAASPATPSSSGAGTSPTTPSVGGSGGGTAAGATCTPGESGPLRRDTEFTATDGSGVVVKYSVSLPEGYFSGCERYPVIYALHGRDQGHADFMDEALGMREAMDAGVLEKSVIVTPDSFRNGRWENRGTGPAEDNLIQRLIPYVEQNFRVRPGASNRLLVGFSMGGHGALRFGLKYPNLWAAVWSVDGAMADSDQYYPFVEGRSSADFQILTVGGKLNGDRVKSLVDDLKQRGIDIPYSYEDVEHNFPAFIQQDRNLGWPAMQFLQKNLGRTL